MGFLPTSLLAPAQAAKFLAPGYGSVLVIRALANKMGQVQKKSHDREYHVVMHGFRWWVENDEGASLHASVDEHDATAWAIQAAQNDHASGLDVIVCVEQPDGSYKTAWHSR